MRVTARTVAWKVTHSLKCAACGEVITPAGRCRRNEGTQPCQAPSGPEQDGWESLRLSRSPIADPSFTPLAVAALLEADSDGVVAPLGGGVASKETPSARQAGCSAAKMGSSWSGASKGKPMSALAKDGSPC